MGPARCDGCRSRGFPTASISTSRRSPPAVRSDCASARLRCPRTMATRSRICVRSRTACACCACYGTIGEAAMPTADPRAAHACACMLAGVLAIASCHPSHAAFPWSAQVPERALEHAEVRTVNADYARRTSHVLVREVDRPTRAALDYAAYHANFMIAAPPPETAPAAARPILTEQPFS